MSGKESEYSLDKSRAVRPTGLAAVVRVALVSVALTAACAATAAARTDSDDAPPPPNPRDVAVLRGLLGLQYPALRVPERPIVLESPDRGMSEAQVGNSLATIRDRQPF